MKHSLTRHTVSRETFTRIRQLFDQHQEVNTTYIDQLLWWNRRINLVSRDVSRETVREHILHSLLLTELDVFKSANFIVDAGTGGGLPGLPLAAVSPEKKWLLNDIVTKKILAVKQMVKRLDLQNVTTSDTSIANLSIHDKFLLISKHAFKIDALYNLVYNSPWSSLVFYKGAKFENELKNISAPLAVSVFDLSRGNAFYADKCIVVLSRK